MDSGILTCFIFHTYTSPTLSAGKKTHWAVMTVHAWGTILLYG